MKNIVKRILVALLALSMAVGILMPVALAVEAGAAPNADAANIYAGTKSKVVLYNSEGKVLDNSGFNWKSSDPKVVSVNSKGVVWGKKAGKSATITATNKKNNKNKVRIKYTVKRNKVDNLQPRPAAKSVTYGNWRLYTKSIEIASTDKVIVEYYLVCNYPSNWRCRKINYIKDYIDIYNRTTKVYFDSLVSGKASAISGFKRYWGKSVQVIKVTYSGSRVKYTNIKASDWAFKVDPRGQINVGYR